MEEYVETAKPFFQTGCTNCTFSISAWAFQSLHILPNSWY